MFPPGSDVGAQGPDHLSFDLAHELLILDATRGDRTLSTTAEGIERLWQVSMPLLETAAPVRLDPPGSQCTS